MRNIFLTATRNTFHAVMVTYAPLLVNKNCTSLICFLMPRDKKMKKPCCASKLLRKQQQNNLKRLIVSLGSTFLFSFIHGNAAALQLWLLWQRGSCGNTISTTRNTNARITILKATFGAFFHSFNNGNTQQIVKNMQDVKSKKKISYHSEI